MGHDPAIKIIVVSYADDLARKFSRDFRAIVTADWYRELFPAMRLGKKTETEIETTQGGYRIAASTGGVLTGRGANLIILDDPIKPLDAESEIARRKNNEWFDKTLFARLDSKQHGSIILVMQRLHQNDLSGHLIEKGGFEVIALAARAIRDERWRLPDGRIHRRKIGEALHPEREGLEVLAEIEASQGSRAFQAQYQQAPVPAEGNLFKRAWLTYGDPPPREQMEVAQSWDTATGIGAQNDRSVGTTWGIKDKIYYLLDVHVGRWDLPELARQVVERARFYKATAVLIENASSGAGLIQLLRSSRLNVIGRKPRLEKQVRAATQSACFEAGRVVLPKSAPWIADYETELLGFPSAKFDDQVDSTTQFLEWAQE
jgi:predicted phage terminase large subunit-like protein